MISSRVVEELTKRFNEFVKTGDDSKIALDLERYTYQTVSHGVRLCGSQSIDSVL
jgi:aminopeptidase 2